MSGGAILFLIFALATCLGAIAVVVSQNVVRMAFWLMVSLGSVAGLFFLLRADFVAATQLLIYVGGTVVLLVFGVMLTASGRFAKIQTTPAEGFLGAGIGSLFLAMLFSTVAAVNWPDLANRVDPEFGMIQQLASADGFKKYDRNEDGRIARTELPQPWQKPFDRVQDRLKTEQELAQSDFQRLLPGEGYNEAGRGNTARPIGLALIGPRTDKDLGKKKGKVSTGYLLPFEIISIHLLVVLIGAAYLARAKRRVDTTDTKPSRTSDKFNVE